jgi:hypothetical protein
MHRVMATEGTWTGKRASQRGKGRTPSVDYTGVAPRQTVPPHPRCFFASVEQPSRGMVLAGGRQPRVDASIAASRTGLGSRRSGQLGCVNPL